jgi:hypothetical protein
MEISSGTRLRRCTASPPSYEAVMLRPSQESREVTPSSDRETLSDITTQGTLEGIKGSRKSHKHCLHGTTTTTDGNNSEAGGFDVQGTQTTTHNDKCQLRLPTDQFKRLLEEACPNHAYPVRHKLNGYSMMRSFMTLGSIT